MLVVWSGFSMVSLITHSTLCHEYNIMPYFHALFTVYHGFVSLFTLRIVLGVFYTGQYHCNIQRLPQLYGWVSSTPWQKLLARHDTTGANSFLWKGWQISKKCVSEIEIEREKDRDRERGRKRSNRTTLRCKRGAKRLSIPLERGKGGGRACA